MQTEEKFEGSDICGGRDVDQIPKTWSGVNFIKSKSQWPWEVSYVVVA